MTLRNCCIDGVLVQSIAFGGGERNRHLSHRRLICIQPSSLRASLTNIFVFDPVALSPTSFSKAFCSTSFESDSSRSPTLLYAHEVDPPLSDFLTRATPERLNEIFVRRTNEITEKYNKRAVLGLLNGDQGIDLFVPIHRHIDASPPISAPTCLSNRSIKYLTLTSPLDTMPSRLAAPVLTVDAGKMHKVDPRNVESLFGMWTGT
jgi:hypothetical protein